ncbi:hypothetical protein [Legionella maceachernii]|uniref:Uncharacterized protein n=1 Tax=Legionella maceachernii TaxID=466 RepID=A0A0W0VXQ5_9GAMM|nr:hypothetical protein [Legionella maceachernii]KTD25076.1 hypothetical protein Lmac_2054 [Legionella maceachernii]SKA12678.1 hypothetical protein SAMN02745128_02184 [Legionella maceachernii]SUP04684.1 Uncharacterised protein [Legionella maceachernii]
MITEIIITLISSGFIIFIYKEFKACWEKKARHDLKIYRKVNSIINDKYILSIIKETQTGYLPKDTYWKVDTLIEFIQLPNNQFLSKNLNTLLSDLTYTLGDIAQLYSMCGKCQLIGEHYKLIAHKNGDPKEFELLNKNKEYSSNLFQKYNNFRNAIKKKFKI